MSPRARHAGVALLFCVALLVLLWLCATAFLCLARSEIAASAARLASHEARSAAESGMAYAAARLSRAGYPAPRPDLSNRVDDWSFRDGERSALAGAKNPSYSHGEPWADDGDGVWEPGEAVLSDIDGDGRPSAWTARLRQSGIASPLRFSLRAEDPGGKIPLNAGIVACREGREDIYSYDIGPNGIQDWRDPWIPYHKGLVHALNNLGASLLPSSHPRREDRPTGEPLGTGHTFSLCWLGEDLVARRPYGGYRSWKEIEETLAPLGYRPDDIAAVRPFISLEADAALSESGRVGARTLADFPPYAPIHLHTAAAEVLASIWTYIAFRHATNSESLIPFWNDRIANVPDPHAGDGAIPYNLTPIILYPREAERLARKILDLRAESSRLDWHQIYARLMESAGEIFREDLDAPGGDPEGQGSYCQAKAETAFQAVCMDPYPADPYGGLLTWAGWGTDRDRDPGNGVQSFPAVSLEALTRVPYPVSPGTPWRSSPATYPYNVNNYYLEWMKPQGAGLAPPSGFRVSCLAECRAGTCRASFPVEGTLRACERIDVTSQEDFENLTGGTNLARRGIRPADEDLQDWEKRHWSARDGDRRYGQVATLPRWNRRSMTPERQGHPHWGFSRLYGAVTLATRQAGPQGARLYWPFGEDFDMDAGTDFLSEGGPVPVPVSPEEDFDALKVNSFHVSQRYLDSPIPIQMGAGFFSEGSVECWMTESGILNVYGEDGSSHITVNNQYGTRFGRDGKTSEFGIDIGYRHWTQGRLTAAARVEAEMPYGPDRRMAQTHHVVAAWKLGPDGRTNVTFCLDGEDMGIGLSVPGAFPPQQACYFGDLVRVDEVRLYDRALTAGEARQRYLLDRFARSGVYTSPLYVADAPIRLRHAQWTGSTPPASFRPADTGVPIAESPPDTDDPVPPEEILSAEIVGYADEAGQVEAGRAPLPLSGAVYDIPAQGVSAAVRSFRYRVRFDCRRVAGVLDDSPVFESIWITFTRGGGRWSAWDEGDGR